MGITARTWPWRVRYAKVPVMIGNHSKIAMTGMNRRLIKLLFLLGACCMAAPAIALQQSDSAERSPTVIVDINAIGKPALDELKQSRGLLWWAEFGNELLVGVQADDLQRWLQRSDTRPGPAALSRDEIVVRDLVCGANVPEPALAVVGGYNLVRRPPALARFASLSGQGGRPLPADGVVAWQPANHGRASAPVEPDEEVAQLVSRVDADRWFDTLEALANYNRNSTSPELPDAHDWILERLADANLSVETHSFQLATCGSRTLPNAIGIKSGQTLPNEWIVVGAHFDSRNTSLCDGSALPQPGANDNASGCAGVIELARVFQHAWTERTIVFACFSGEEQGLVGSRAWVASLLASGQLAGVRHMINLDMIGHAIDDSLAARVETTQTFASELNRYIDAAATYAPELSINFSTQTQAYSDHWSFIERGIPGVFTWENGAAIYPHYHRETDLPENMQRARPLAGGILRMDTAVLAELAGLLPTPIFMDQFEMVMSGSRKTLMTCNA